jgi:hypothetical protein
LQVSSLTRMQCGKKILSDKLNINCFYNVFYEFLCLTGT